MSFIVTGAAGFIGANIVKGLNNRGCNDVIAVDNLTQADKFVNLADHHIIDYFDKVDFIEKVKARKIAKPEAIFHEGACSDTMEHNGHYMMENSSPLYARAFPLVPGRKDPLHLCFLRRNLRRIQCL